MRKGEEARRELVSWGEYWGGVLMGCLLVLLGEKPNWGACWREQEVA